jgi:hypothetical protein
MTPDSYLQHFNFFITNEWTKLDRVLYYTRIERVGKGKHSSLLDLFISYKENEVL